MRRALLLLVVVALAGCGGGEEAASTQPATAGGVQTLDNILALRSDFEADTGKTRALILLSPTWGTCLAGARAVRESILAKEASDDLRVYVVWLKQRSTDALDTIEESTLADPRVTQYWDGEGITGTYFAESDLGALGYSGFVYDVYYVFGPEARWADDPEPLVGARAPVVSHVEQLLADIRGQL